MPIFNMLENSDLAGVAATAICGDYLTGAIRYAIAPYMLEETPP
jgi:hypothetical protein